MIDDATKEYQPASDSAGGTRAEYQRLFRENLERMWEITQRKNNDYAREDDPFRNFREFGELGFLVRMSDKWSRIKCALYEKQELQVTDETIEDTLLDLANYCNLLICYRKMTK
jgi:hypothetical protein